jgi:hypothetical protein
MDRDDLLRLVGEVCVVVWRDAYFDFDRNGGAESDRDDFLVKTYGELRMVGEKFIDLVSEALPDGDERAITHIPIVLVERAYALMEVSLAL